MKKLFPIGSLGLAGLLGAELLAMPGATVAAPSEGTFLKRDEDVSEVVLVADDDDTFDRSRTRDTRSRYTASRSTRDHTRDGGDRNRDHSQNRTNDRSRNDTRR